VTSSLNCPTCGAAAAGPDASRCDYCGSTLTSVACPACFGAMFAGMQFCPHCGAKAARTIDESATLTCPGCRGEMRGVQVGATSMFECAACAGNWLVTETFTHLCLSREERGGIAAMVGSGGIELAAPSRGSVRYLPCPLCAKIMNRENFGRRSGVIIDVCKGHGVWFERRELQAVMAFIDSGGLERARAFDEQRRAEERRLDAVQQGDGTIIHRQYQSIVVHIGGSSAGQGGKPVGQQLIDEALRLLFS
jgi:Zn-finger nucleic acid-binding protein